VAPQAKGWTEGEAEDAADQWLLHGQDEHASVASFARFSLDLLRFAAPPGLLLAAHNAASDEVRHATAAFKLASHFNAAKVDNGVEVMSFPSGESVSLAPSLEVLVSRTLEEGCQGESAAVARLARTLAVIMPASPAAQPIRDLFKDESRHAALAWNTVAWAASTGANVSSAASDIMAAIGERQQAEGARDLDAETLSLTWAGRVPSKDAKKIRELVDRHWVAPWIFAIARKEPLPVVIVPAGEVADALASAVMQAAHSVQSYIDRAEFLPVAI